MKKKKKKLHVTQLHGDQVTKRHYKSLKCHYRLFKKATIGSLKMPL